MQTLHGSKQILDRAQVIDASFSQHVKDKHFPPARIALSLAAADLSSTDFLELFDSQMISRHLDLKARELKMQNLGYYTIGSSGHEGNAAVALAFRITDVAFLHYRSGAFMAQRAKVGKQTNFIEEQLLSLVASKDDPIAGGRHKVFGSTALHVPPQTSTIASHFPKAVGAALSITRAKELNIEKHWPEESVILCSFGDASINHSVAQGALNAMQWITHGNYPLPLVLICEDNGIGISVPTPSDWIENTVKNRQHIHYIQADGLHLADIYQAAKQAATIARVKKEPVFLHLKMVRLMGHAGSDIESQYHTQAEIAETEFNDPLLHSAKFCLDNHILTEDEIIHRYETIRAEVNNAAQQALQHPKLTGAIEVMSSIIPPAEKHPDCTQPSESEREKIFGEHYPQLQQPRNMCQLINYTLTDLMFAHKNILIFGEDVGKKGGVYRVTADLMKRFGQRRVFDTLLDETTILGNAIGFAMNGFLPMPEIQFLAYYHNACDQIRGEAATQSFFSNGQYSNPMVVRIPGLAYQKGFGGHFHNDNTLAVFRDIPGVIVACPSNGLDAAKMLRTCVEMAQYEKRVIIFIEPIALYMTRDLHEINDQAWLQQYPAPSETIPFGEISIYDQGHNTQDSTFAIITYGNGYFLARQAAKILQEKHNIATRIIDLRWLAPLNQSAIIAAVEHCQHILIVDECRKTGSLSEELVTLLVEQLSPVPHIKRLTGHDSFIPLGQAWQYVLPSREDIVAAVVGMQGSAP